MPDGDKTDEERLAEMQAEMERLRMETEGARNAALAANAESERLRVQLAGATAAAPATAAAATSSPAPASTAGATTDGRGSPNAGTTGGLMQGGVSGLGGGLSSPLSVSHRAVGGVQQIRTAKAPPKIPKQSEGFSIWQRRMSAHLTQEGLGMTILPDTTRIPVISCADQTFLVRSYGEPMVAAHLRAADLLFEACKEAPFESRMYACSSVPELWAMIEKWFRPSTNADKHLLRRQLETLHMEAGTDPKLFLADILSREMNLKAIGVEIPEAEMVQLILRQLSDDFDVEKRTIIVSDPDISRADLEQRINASYSVRKANSLGKRSTAAAPAASTASAAQSNPHALAVGQGDGFRQGGRGGSGRHPGGGGGSWGHGLSLIHI